MARCRLLITLVAAFAVASCGVPAQDEPQAVELPRQPFTAPASTAPAVGDVAEVLCFTRDERLVEVVRRVDTVRDAAGQVADLVAGPTAAERDSGISTTLVGLTFTVDAPAGGGRVTVEVSEAEEGGARSDEVLVYGQIVCTLTSRADVTSVEFVRDGARLAVPRADGSLAEGPLRADDYRGLTGPR